jgi:hypothetical protein
MRWWCLALVGCACASFFEAKVSPVEPKPSARRGRELLLNRSYLKVGVPVGLVDALNKPRMFTSDELAPVEGRSLFNAAIPLGYSGKVLGEVPVVAENCLLCHAGPLRGEWVLGLGNTVLDATLPQDDWLVDDARARELGATPEELRTLEDWVRYQRDVAPYDRAPTTGLVPALYFTGWFFSHRKPDDFSWVSTAYYPMLATPPPPTDVPAWWLLKKKQRLYYGGELTGERTRALMQFMSPPGNSFGDLETSERDFEDILAFLLTLEPPKFPGRIDLSLAARGKAAFEKICADCHGTYGPGGVYPSKVVPLEEVDTDPARSQFMHQLGFAAHYDKTWFAERSHMEETSGYVAPPLDGVWATAPYLHNGSVPTLDALLNPSKRPKYFRRGRDSREYDLERVGWKYPVVTPPYDGSARDVYDTTKFGCGNGGHEFGLELSDEERPAVLEYLKTL